MDKIFNWTSTVIGIVGGFFVAIFGQWDSILWALLVIMLLDYLTGVIKAIYTKTMSSEIGFKGLLKKITILIIVALSNVLQQITGDNVAIREIVIMFYVANEYKCVGKCGGDLPANAESNKRYIASNS